ncbi:kinase-like protein [Suillus subluteus]|nr:kinase-like protein [Suillus subluteus]
MFINFVEEPLGIPADQGHGYLRVEFGGSIDPEKRFKIIRKLGDKKYVAIKVLKGYSTGLFERGIMLELPALERSTLGSPPPGLTSSQCLHLLYFFKQPGKSRDGNHLCFVTDVLGGDVKSLQKEVARNKGLPLPLVKRIMMHTLRGLAHMHALQIVHMDLKQDNIMFDMGSLTQADIAAIIETDPARRHPPEEGLDCVVQAAVSQPLPLPLLADAMMRNYIIANFGITQPANVHATDEISAYALRALETILKSPWNEKVDIWAFGCMIFELLTGRDLFAYKAFPEYNLDEPTGHLWQMLCFTCENMTRMQVKLSRLGTKYFILNKNIDNPFCRYPLVS